MHKDHPSNAKVGFFFHAYDTSFVSIGAEMHGDVCCASSCDSHITHDVTRQESLQKKVEKAAQKKYHLSEAKKIVYGSVSLDQTKERDGEGAYLA